MLQTDHATSEAVLTGIIAAFGAPTVLWFAAKGKLADLFFTKPEARAQKEALERALNDVREDLEDDINGMGGKHEAMMSLYNQLRAESDSLRDRCVRIEASQSPVKAGMDRVEQKLDNFLARQEEHGRTLATHAEQIKSLFSQRKI